MFILNKLRLSYVVPSRFQLLYLFQMDFLQEVLLAALQ